MAINKLLGRGPFPYFLMLYRQALTAYMGSHAGPGVYVVAIPGVATAAARRSRVARRPPRGPPSPDWEMWRIIIIIEII